jgi:RNA repair, ligase-Pnkp-associating, region of Hen1
LGYLLHKHPARIQTEELSFGRAHVFYPEADADLCTVAVLLEVDPVALVRGRRGPAGEGDQLQQYLNDRPYAANSFLSVALGRLFSTALSGRSKERQELAEIDLPFIGKLPAVAIRGEKSAVECGESRTQEHCQDTDGWVGYEWSRRYSGISTGPFMRPSGSQVRVRRGGKV